jgi:hypothetical protein
MLHAPPISSSLTEEVFQQKYWSENVKGKDNFQDIGVDGKIILELILGKSGGKMWIGFI